MAEAEETFAGAPVGVGEEVAEEGEGVAGFRDAVEWRSQGGKEAGMWFIQRRCLIWRGRPKGFERKGAQWELERARDRR